MQSDYTSITELPATLLTPEQMHRFAHRYGYAQRLAHKQRILEVACGAGAGLNILSESATYTVGLDTSGGVLHHARQDTTAPLVQGDAQHLPFVAESFDLILCFEAIYYLKKYQSFISESFRLLAPGGKIAICQSNPDWPNFVPGALTTHYPSLPALTASLKIAGFHTIKCYGTLPITTSTPRQQMINTLRRWIMQSGLVAWLGPVKARLQRLSYGRLYPLPATVDASWIATWQAGLEQIPVSTAQPDRIHRVLYIEGTK